MIVEITLEELLGYMNAYIGGIELRRDLKDVDREYIIKIVEKKRQDIIDGSMVVVVA